MKHIKIFINIVILFILCTNVVYAECDSEQLKKYKTMADNIKISYEYIENSDQDSDDKNNLFAIHVSNIPQEIEIFENNQSYLFQNLNDELGSITQENFIGGSNLKFIFYTTDKSLCPNQKIKQSNINLPVYNEFYKDELCNGIESYIYCNKIIPNKITYEGFKKNVLKYKESTIQKEIKEENNNYKINHIVIICILSSILLAIIVIIFIKRKKRINI